MLLTLAVSTYISFLCWSWGSVIIAMLNKLSSTRHDSSFHFSITCLAGLAGITITAGFLSFFLPLGGWLVQLILLLPVLFFWLNTPAKKIAALKSIFNGFHFTTTLLLIVSILMLLIISSWKIVHPDTLGYHAQTIRWIEEYRAVPGLVHLHTRYGYQGLWFVASALFSYKFIVANAVTFINISVLFWFLVFVTDKISKQINGEGSKIQLLLWLGLLILCTWSYTQIRLTAVSASPDFIAALLVWTVIYLLVKKTPGNDADWLLILLLAFFAVTVKLSVAPILIIAAAAIFIFLKRIKLKLLLLSLGLFVLSTAPYIVRNIITSGYVVFPSPSPDIIKADWKYDPYLTALEKDYISAYARIPVEHTKEEIDEVLSMRLFEWLPYWWKNRSAADKTALLLVIFSVPIGLVLLIKKSVINTYFKLALFVSFSGALFWFIQAPDPRFGFGFIIPLAALPLQYLFSEKASLRISRKIIFSLILLTSIAISAYSTYRLIYFFSPKQLVSPVGIENSEYITVTCHGIEYIIPKDNKDCGDLQLPCIYDSCEDIFPRGNKLTDGFRAK